MRPLREQEFQLLETTFPSGNRDFCLFRVDEDGTWQSIHAIDLLTLERAGQVIDTVAARAPALAQNLALCRLLVPCLHYRGNRRHLVIESWGADELIGTSLPVDTRTRLAQKLSDEQAEQYRLITSGERPPADSLAQAFWEAQAELPWLEPTFEDAELGRFAKALHGHLVEEGEGEVELDWKAMARKLEACRRSDFAALQLDGSGRQYRRTFKKLLAVTVRWSSQLTGEVARRMVAEQLQTGGQPPLNATEQTLLEFRYGAMRALGDINVCFLGNPDSLTAEMVNFLFVLHATEAPRHQRAEAERILHVFVDLIRRYRQRRKDARAAERRENRQRYAPPLPDQHAGRNPAWEGDARVQTPDAEAEKAEDLACIEQLLDRLKPRDAKRVRAWRAADGDLGKAAAVLGVTREKFSRQWRQTTWPNVQRAAEQMRNEHLT